MFKIIDYRGYISLKYIKKSVNYKKTTWK
jgi:hypothetical protein